MVPTYLCNCFHYHHPLVSPCHSIYEHGKISTEGGQYWTLILAKRGSLLHAVLQLLRNPAYKGTACFGKTQVGIRKKAHRSLRLKSPSRRGDTASHERPRADWIEIPVPAIISEETFALAQERLMDNKRFSKRR
ncbi:MAG: recombinase family protein, partial [Magnetococcales bacterium]|nr:recombinase family protein [Magnetococcales bacterium]